MNRLLDRRIFQTKALLCIVLMLNVQFWIGGCGSDATSTSPTGWGLGAVRVELSPDHPLSKALVGTNFEGPVAMEYNTSVGQFRVIYPQDDREINGNFMSGENGLFISRLSLEMGTSSAARDKDIASARRSGQSVTLSMNEARQVTSIVAGDGTSWVRPSHWVSAGPQDSDDVTVHDFLDANADLMALAQSSGGASVPPEPIGGGASVPPEPIGGGTNSGGSAGNTNGDIPPQVKADQSAFIPVLGVFVALAVVTGVGFAVAAALTQIFLITAAILLILQPQAAWAMTLGANAQRTWRSPFSGVEKMKHEWTLDNGVPSVQLVIAANGVPELVDSTFGTTTEGRLRAISPSDGSDQWAFKMSGTMFGYPTIAPGGTTYLTSYGGGAWALRAVGSDGKERWSAAIEGSVSSDLAVGPNGRIHLLVNLRGDSSTHGRLYAFEQDGKQKWAFDFAELLSSSFPAIGHDGTIYVMNSVPATGNQTARTKLYAIGSDGKEQWSGTSEGSPGLCPAVGRDGTIFLPVVTAGQRAGVRAFRPDGTEAWTWTSPVTRASAAYLPLAAALGPDDTVYVPVVTGNDAQDPASCQTNIYALRSTNGSEKWVYSAVARAAGYVSVGGTGTVYFVAGKVTVSQSVPSNFLEAKLFALNPNGELQSECDLPAASEQATVGQWLLPVIGPGRLYTIGILPTGTIHAIGEK